MEKDRGVYAGEDQAVKALISNLISNLRSKVPFARQEEPFLRDSVIKRVGKLPIYLRDICHFWGG